MWTQNDQDQFNARVMDLWPAWGEERYQGLIRFYAEELHSLPVARICHALRVIRRRNNRFPDVEEILSTVSQLRGQDPQAKEERTERENLEEELSKVAAKRGRWRSPKGWDCEVTTHGLQAFWKSVV